MTMQAIRPLPTALSQLRRAAHLSRVARMRAACALQQTDISWDLALGSGATVKPSETIVIGPGVSIGANFHCEVDAFIDEGCLISSNVALIGHDHDLSDPSVAPTKAPRLTDSAIHVHRHAFIGFGATIVGPCVIGEGAIVGARALVLSDVAPRSTVVGIPARPTTAKQPPTG